MGTARRGVVGSDQGDERMKEKPDSEAIQLDTHQQLRAYLAQSEKAAKQKSTADDSHRRHTGQR